MRLRRLTTAAAIAALAGCGTIGDMVKPRGEAFDSPGPHVYGGVRLDAVLGAEMAVGHLAPVSLIY